MAASVNNIAATFATAPIPSSLSSSSSSSSSSSYSNSNQATFALSMSHKPISTSWNPHRNLHRSQKSSLINLYGPPGPPPPFQETCTARDPRLISIPKGGKLPNVTLSCLGPNGRVQNVAVSSLAKGKKLLLVGVSAAFSPNCSHFVKRIEAMKGKSGDFIACVAANDEFVMRAWSQHLGVGEKVMMLSDGRGELATALGLSIQNDGSAGSGLAVRSRRFCLAAVNGVITTVHLDDSDDYFISRPTGRCR